MRPPAARASPGFLALSSVLAVVTLATAGDAEPTREQRALARLRSPPRGLPPVPLPEDNRPTVEKIALGRKLFFDRRLSSNDTMSCAMCHIPEQGFTNNELSTPVGVGGRSLRRNAPTVLNAAYLVHVFLDGRERSLEKQVLAPLFAHDEMGNSSAGRLVAEVARLPDYRGLFEKAFGGGPSMERIGKAIATWERTLLAANAPFDRWRYDGEADAMTEESKRGFALFTGKARCAECHPAGAEHALFTDHAFHDTGIGYLQEETAARGEDTPVLVEIAPEVVVAVERRIVRQVAEPRPPDHGRFEVTRDPEDKWRFRTPSLRNVAVTAPYMHDGSLSTLDAVVRFYDRGGAPHPGLDPLIRPLGLSEAEIAAVVAFLRALTSSDLAELKDDARSVAVGN